MIIMIRWSIFIVRLFLQALIATMMIHLHSFANGMRKKSVQKNMILRISIAMTRKCFSLSLLAALNFLVCVFPRFPEFWRFTSSCEKKHQKLAILLSTEEKTNKFLVYLTPSSTHSWVNDTSVSRQNAGLGIKGWNEIVWIRETFFRDEIQQP
jgi:hypothetical protein